MKSFMSDENLKKLMVSHHNLSHRTKNRK